MVRFTKPGVAHRNASYIDNGNYLTSGNPWSSGPGEIFHVKKSGVTRRIVLGYSFHPRALQPIVRSLGGTYRYVLAYGGGFGSEGNSSTHDTNKCISYENSSYIPTANKYSNSLSASTTSYTNSTGTLFSLSLPTMTISSHIAWVFGNAQRNVSTDYSITVRNSDTYYTRAASVSFSIQLYISGSWTTIATRSATITVSPTSTRTVSYNNTSLRNNSSVSSIRVRVSSFNGDYCSWRSGSFSRFTCSKR